MILLYTTFVIIATEKYGKAHIPEHLMNEYEIYIQLIAGIRILSATIEECIKEGLLTEPKQKLGAEGMIMVVEK